MISIITAIHNQIEMNRIYYQSIVESTDGEWELIVIDNSSDDGSAEWLEQSGDHRVRVIRTGGNYSYPYCQNLGIRHAKGDVYAFFNNDILLPPHWDTRALTVLGHDGQEALTLSSNDRAVDRRTTKRISRRWKRVKYPIIMLAGSGRRSLKAMAALTYGGSFERYAEKMWERHGRTMLQGFSGSAVMMTKRAIELIGEWDETQQGADFDLYMRTMQRHEIHGDIKPLGVLNGVFHHHYQRLTLKSKHPEFTDRQNLKKFEDKWDENTIKRYFKPMDSYTSWGEK